MKNCAFLLLFLAVAANASLNFKDCGGASAVGKLVDVLVSKCTDAPCSLQKGANYTITISFSMSETTDAVIADVSGILDGVTVPFPLDNNDGCKNSGLECPLKDGGQYKYMATLNVLKSYPEVKLIVQWKLMDKQEGGNVIVCFEIPVAIVG